MLIINGVEVKREQTPAKAHWLSNEPAGPYTTMRTVDSTWIVEGAVHVQRLVDTAHSLLEKIRTGSDSLHRATLNASDRQRITDIVTMREIVRDSTATALRLFDAREDSSNVAEKRITILLNWGASEMAEKAGQEVAELKVQVYVEPLPPLRSEPVPVVVRQRPPEAKMYEGKDSKWVKDRRHLEEEKGDANEVVLTNEKGQAVEGTQTNFFVVKNGAVYTAPPSEVLVGTIRVMIERMCREAGIPFIEESPSAAEHRSWEGAFLSSTSRLVLAINELRVHEDAVGGDRELAGTFSLPVSPIITQLAELVLGDLREDAMDVSGSEEKGK